MSSFVDQFLTRQFIAELTLVGMAFDVMGGLYLAYDLLGGKHGPLRSIARATSYATLFFVGYFAVLGTTYAFIASLGMGGLLAIEYRVVAKHIERHEPGRHPIVLFGMLRGAVLGVASMALAGPVFGVVFGLLSGAGLSVFYMLGYAPVDDYELSERPNITAHKLWASATRALAVMVAGIVAGLVRPPVGHSGLIFGLKLGCSAGLVSALVGLFSPVIEWWIDNLREKRLGVLGLCLIFFGMTLQSAQYWAVVLNLAVR